MENEKVTRLGKPVRKGLLGFVFSRFFLIVLLLIAEILLLAILHRWFLDKLPVLMYLQYVFTFVMVIYLLNNSMDSSAKLTWLLVISIVPVPGTILLLLTQKNIGHRMETRMVRDQSRNRTERIMPKR